MKDKIKTYIKIRRIKTKDIHQLIKLYTSAPEINDYEGQFTKKRFLSYVGSKSGVLLVAEKDGEIMGAIDADFYKESDSAYLANVVISKKNRRKGIGGMLIKKLEKLCKDKGLKVMMVLVYDWNKEMHPVMGHYGYKSRGKMVFYIKRLNK